MAITAAMVKELRESTGAGMMECKKALTETNGDMDAAVEYLRKNGIMKAEKKASRIAAEGLTRIAVKDDKTAAVVEVNSETDFVAQNEKFQAFVEAVATQAVNSDSKDLESFMAEKWNLDESKTVNDALVEITAVISEKLNKVLGGIRDMKRIPDAIFVVDPKKERICIQEAETLGITLIGIGDTNCDPEELDYIIPGNDDAIRAVKLLVGKMADAVIEANQGAENLTSEAEAEAEAAEVEE